MDANQETCWSLIQAAAKGDSRARDGFAHRYLPVVRAYLGARWRATAYVGYLEDAVQEVFLDCFRKEGALERADPGKGEGFRRFLFGVARNVALRFETRRAREAERKGPGSFHGELLAADETSLSKVFDRAWARAVVREAVELQAAQAREKGDEAVKRVEPLQLRIHEGLPIREIARRWSADPARLHHDYAQARKELMAALGEVLRLQNECRRESMEKESLRLMDLFN